jgi:peptide/nickel transport system permease protein
MVAYLARRLTDLVIAVLGVSTIVFVLLRLSGDPIAMLVPQDATAEQIEEVRRSYGFSDPLWVQYVRFLWNAAQGDLGRSLQFRRPSVELVLETLPATLQLTVAALLFATIIAVPAGVIAAVNRNTALDKLLTVLTLLGQSMPYFWLGILRIMIFAVRLGVLPTSGSGGLQHLILPAITLSAGSMARTSRLVRSGMLRVLSQDYVRTAHAKGLGRLAVLSRHALRNAAIPVVTVLTLDFGVLLGGAVVTETIFAWPGLGRLIVQAISLRDFPVVQAGVLYLSIVFVVLNALADLLYVQLDPRIRHA